MVFFVDVVSVRWRLWRHDGLHGDGETETLQHVGDLLLRDAMFVPPGDTGQGWEIMALNITDLSITFRQAVCEWVSEWVSENEPKEKIASERTHTDTHY